MLFRKRRDLSLLERLERRRKRIFWVSSIFVFSALIIIGCLIYVVRTYTVYAQDLVSKDRLLNRHFRGLIIYDNKNQIIYESDGAYEVGTASILKVPRHLKYATLAAEDAGFYEHPGFSWQGIIRSLTLNFQKNNPYAYGGSTITQQLVKNALLDDRSKSYVRKLNELVLAVGVDQRYSKDQILEMYLNSSYYGRGAYGIAQASSVYFNKPIEELTVAEAAYLSGLPNAPSVFGSQPDKATQRQLFILGRMRDEKFITQEDFDSAQTSQIILADRKLVRGRFPHFSLYVRQQVIDMFGANALEDHGYRVFTTLDSSLQEYSQKAVFEHLEKLSKNKATNGAAIALDSATSAIRAMVGSADWDNDEIDGKFNVTLSMQQPGSSFKPFVYMRAIERNIISPATMLIDSPTTFAGNYSPKNYDGKFRGPVTTRRALANSLNLPAVEVMDKVGLGDVVAYTRALGLSSLGDPSNYGLSLVLGGGEITPLEITNAYATMASGGIYNQAYAIEKIVDKYGRAVYSRKAENQRVANENAVYIVTSMLSDTNARQEIFGSSLNLPSKRPAAVKTGTTNDYRDAWTIGYTPSYAVGVWVGNNNNAAMDSVAGSLGAAPIWIAMMDEANKIKPIEQFSRPPGVFEGEVCQLIRKTVSDNGQEKSFYEFKVTKEIYIRGSVQNNCNDVRRQVEELQRAEAVSSSRSQALPDSQQKKQASHIRNDKYRKNRD